MTAAVREAIRSAIRDHDGDGAPSDYLLTHVAGGDVDVADTLDKMEAEGEVYVVPVDGDDDRVKLTSR